MDVVTVDLGSCTGPFPQGSIQTLSLLAFWYSGAKDTGFKRDTGTEGSIQPAELLTSYASITPWPTAFTCLTFSLPACQMGTVPPPSQGCLGNW